MAEYLVYHGPFTADTTDPGILAIKAEGLTVSVTGARQALAEWMPVLENSSVLKGTVKNGKVSLESYVNANKYSTWTWFTDDEFDEFGKVYNSVKGSTKTFSVKPSKTKD